MTTYTAHSKDRLWEVFGKTKEEWEAMEPQDRFGLELSIVMWSNNPDGTQTAVLSSDVRPDLLKDEDNP